MTDGLNFVTSQHRGNDIKGLLKKLRTALS